MQDIIRRLVLTEVRRLDCFLLHQTEAHPPRHLEHLIKGQLNAHLGPSRLRPGQDAQQRIRGRTSGQGGTKKQSSTYTGPTNATAAAPDLSLSVPFCPIPVSDTEQPLL